MRINKKLLTNSLHKNIRSSFGEEYLDINFRDVNKFIAISVGVIFLIIFVCSWWSFATPSKSELAQYKSSCNLLAGRNRHYTTRTNSAGNSGPMLCKVIDTTGQTTSYQL